MRDEGIQPSRLVAPEEVMLRLGVTSQTLKTWRRAGKGPRWVRFSARTVRYVLSSVEEAASKQPPWRVRAPRPSDMGFIYFIRAKGGCGPVKIGWSRTPSARLAQLQVGHPYPLEFAALVRGTMNEESEMHVALARQRLVGEWFADCPEIRDVIASLQEGAPTAVERCEGDDHEEHF